VRRNTSATSLQLHRHHNSSITTSRNHNSNCAITTASPTSQLPTSRFLVPNSAGGVSYLLKIFLDSRCLNPNTSVKKNPLPTQKLYRAGIFKQSMRARNRIRRGLSYRPARLHRLAELNPWNRFLDSLKV
jgi:hypothetical protein